MALNKQIWLSTIMENFFPDNSFAVKSVDDSAFVNNKTVHVPNAGAPSSVAINRQNLPASVSKRTDYDLTYDIDELTTDPILIPNIDTVELSYDKRQSVLANDKQQLQTVAQQNLLYRWFLNDTIIKTTGDGQDAHTSSTATGQRRKITKKDVLEMMKKFNVTNVPKDNRYLLLDSVMYADLIADLSEKELWAFQNSADVEKGIMGMLYSFNVMERSQVLRMKANGTELLRWDENAVAGEKAAGIAWQLGCVSRAMGETKMFDNTDDPTYYGDIYSFLLRCGGKYRRYDKKGVGLIVEDTCDETPTIEGADSIDLASGAGNVVRTYATSNGAGITAESDADWLTVSVSGKKVTFTRTAYAYDAEGELTRTATVTIGIEGTNVTKTVAVTQEMAANV